MTPRRVRCDSSDQRDIELSAEPIDANEPADRIEHAEPTEPIDRNEPTDPIDSIEPFEPIERNESSDHNAHRDRDDVVMTQARSAMTAIAALRPLIAMTLPAGCVAAPQR